MSETAADVVGQAAARLVGRGLDGPPERLALGYGNENWRVDAGGRPFLIKIAQPGADLGKASAASKAYRLAATTSAPVPHEVAFDPSCELLGSRIVRVLEFLPGAHPGPSLADPATRPRFFESFGRAVAALHSAECPAFASRIGGTPSFPTWIEYVEYRVPQIRQRGRSSAAFTESEMTSMFDRAVGVAREISGLVQPRLCHRDLYLDNLLIDAEGRLSAILDLDLAEAWDCCVDFVKPRSQVFGPYDGAAETFYQGYAAVAGGLPDAFEERVFVAAVLELSNQVVNAVAGGDVSYAGLGRDRLTTVLESRI